MSKSRVVVVDDSAFMRKLISEMINSDEKFEVIAKLRNGKELIERVNILKPDVITLDLEMPELDGVSTLKKLKEENINIPVIMLSSNTVEGSDKTIECLENGAVDFIQKPSGAISLDINKIEKDLLDKLKWVTSKSDISSKVTTKIVNDTKVNKINNNIVKKGKVDAVLIGASTGGPRALQSVLTELDCSINKPVLVVQHMPVGFTNAFAKRLDKMCKLKVVEAEDGMNVEKNIIYIAKGGNHMIVTKDKKIKLTDEPTLWGVRPAVDKLFESAIDVYRGNILACILTGMGRDGANGISQIKDAGGMTIAESERTCVIYGMPKAAVETGKVDYILELDQVGNKIMELSK